MDQSNQFVVRFCPVRLAFRQGLPSDIWQMVECVRQTPFYVGDCDAGGQAYVEQGFGGVGDSVDI